MRSRRLSTNVTAAIAVILFSAPVASVSAQRSSGPKPVPMPPPIETPLDSPYSGVISLSVNLTDTIHRVVVVHESIPVRPGKVTLLYPEWIPGDHSAAGPIQRLVGLTIAMDGKSIPWVRDPVNMYAFHLDVPDGESLLDVDFTYLAAIRPTEGRVEFSSKIVDLSWNTVLLYPAGYFLRQIRFSPSVVLPGGWKFATALQMNSQDGDAVHFKTTTLNTLVDSPLCAGINSERIDISPDASNPVFIDVFADEPADLKITSKELREHKNLVVQAQKLFDSKHYKHYDFLCVLSDVIGQQGLEHHQSSEDATGANYFTDWAGQAPKSDLLAHEYVHSWNGKFLRPADLWTPNLNVPMRDDLLWIYEGLTQYWGYVLAARSGMRTPEDTRDLLAAIAAGFEASPGRKWRSLADTTDQPLISGHRSTSWPSQQRLADYYMEGVLVWLDVDTKIFELSKGTKSLDDFAKLFYGMDNDSFITHTFDFDDVVVALNKIQPYDWAEFLDRRVYRLNPSVPENGFTQGGYRLIYNDQIPTWEAHGGNLHYGYGENVESLGFTGEETYDTSLGFTVIQDGSIGNVWWDSPAFKAGFTPGMQLMAVNGQAYTADKLRGAIMRAENAMEPLLLLVKDDNQMKTIALNYHGGLRYPHLERLQGTPDYLDSILAPVK